MHAHRQQRQMTTMRQKIEQKGAGCANKWRKQVEPNNKLRVAALAQKPAQPASLRAQRASLHCGLGSEVMCKTFRPMASNVDEKRQGPVILLVLCQQRPDDRQPSQNV